MPSAATRRFSICALATSRLVRIEIPLVSHLHPCGATTVPRRLERGKKAEFPEIALLPSLANAASGRRSMFVLSASRFQRCTVVELVRHRDERRSIDRARIRRNSRDDIREISPSAIEPAAQSALSTSGIPLAPNLTMSSDPAAANGGSQ
jgi:hypothetical protein